MRTTHFARFDSFLDDALSAPWRLFYEQDDVAGLQLVLAGVVETFELAELLGAAGSVRRPAG